MKLFVFSKSSTRVFKRSNNCACGKPAAICALDTNASDDAQDHDLLGAFCADCALESIRNLPPCSWLHIMESRSEGKRTVKRNYKIYSINDRSNRADIVIIDGQNQFLCAPRLAIRLDTIPHNSR